MAKACFIPASERWGGAGGLTAATLALAVIVGEIYTVGSASHQLVSYPEGKIRLGGCYVIRRMGGMLGTW